MNKLLCIILLILASFSQIVFSESVYALKGNISPWRWWGYDIKSDESGKSSKMIYKAGDTTYEDIDIYKKVPGQGKFIVKTDPANPSRVKITVSGENVAYAYVLVTVNENMKDGDGKSFKKTSSEVIIFYPGETSKPYNDGDKQYEYSTKCILISR